MSDPTRPNPDAVTTPVGVTTLCPQCGASMPAFETRCSGCGHHKAAGTEDEQRAALRARLQSGIGDAYELLELVGKGGMGVVFRAKEKALDREVALKVLAFDPVLVPEAFARFEREAKLAARLDHPHIVPIFAVGQGRGIAYYTMRLVRGGSLEDMLGRDKKIDPERAIKYLKEIASALDHAHAHGVVHRDIKPANVMLGDGDHVFVADFGIARAVEGGGTALTSTGVIGSPAYMAPEQWQGQAIDGRADQYAFGILAYELLTGKRPYRDATMHELLRLHLTEDLPDISQDLSSATPAMRDALRRATAKEPADRFPTTGDFVKALEGTLPVGTVKTQAMRIAATKGTGAVGPRVAQGRVMEERSRVLPIGLGVIAIGAIAFFALKGPGTTPESGVAAAPPRTDTVILKQAPDTIRVAAPTAPPETVRVATPPSAVPTQQGTVPANAPGSGRALPPGQPRVGAGVVGGGYIMVAHPGAPRGTVRIGNTTTMVSGPPVAIPVAPGGHVVSFRGIEGRSFPNSMPVFVRPGDTVRVFFVPAEGGGPAGDSLRAQAAEMLRRMNAQRGFGRGQRGGRGRGDTLPPPAAIPPRD